MRRTLKQVLIAGLSLALIGIVPFRLWAAQVDSSASEDGEVVFSVTPGEVERNGTVTLRWSAAEAESVTIQLRYGSYKQAPERQYAGLTPDGTLEVDLTQSDDDVAEQLPQLPYIHNVSFWLIIPDETGSAFTPGLRVLDTVEVAIRCPFDGFFFGVDPSYRFCPLEAPRTVEAVMQPFEHGILIWRSDNDARYVLTTYGEGDQRLSGSALAFPPEWDGTSPTGAPTHAPISGIRPDPHFVDLLNSGHGIVIGIGAATAPATDYEMTVQDSFNDSLSSAVAYMTLPSGQTVRYLEDLYSAGWQVMGDGA